MDSFNQQSAITPVEDFIDGSPPDTSETTLTQSASQDADSECSTLSDEYTLALDFTSLPQYTPEKAQDREECSTSLDLQSLRDAMSNAESPSPMPEKHPFPLTPFPRRSVRFQERQSSDGAVTPRRSARILKRKSTEDGEAPATVRRKRSLSKQQGSADKRRKRSASKGSTPPPKKTRRSRSRSQRRMK